MSLYFDFDTPENPDYLGLCNNADGEPVAVLKVVKQNSVIIDAFGTSSITRYNRNLVFTPYELITFKSKNPSLTDICCEAFDELVHAHQHKVDLGAAQGDPTAKGVNLMHMHQAV